MKTRDKYLAIAFSILLAVLFFYYFGNIAVYIIAGWAISLLGLPIVNRLMKIKIRKWQIGSSLAAALTLVLFIGGIFLFFVLIFPPIIEQAKNLSSIDPQDLSQTLEAPIANIEQVLYNYGLLDQNTTLDQEINRYAKSVFDPKQFLDFFRSFIGSVTSFIIGVFSILFISFFFLKDKNLFDRLVATIIPDNYEEKSNNSIHQSSLMLRKYFSGVLIQLSFFFIIVLILLLIFGFKNALLIAFIAALLNIIPYLGPLVGAIFGTFITISSNVGMDFYADIMPQLGLLILLFIIVQQIDGFIIQPYVFSTSIKAHPLEIFLIVLMGGQIAGVPGMILAIPAYTVARVIAKVFFNEFNIVRRLAEGLSGEKNSTLT